MGELVAPRWVTVLAALIAAIIIVLNIKLLYDLAFPANDAEYRWLLGGRSERPFLWVCHAIVAS